MGVFFVECLIRTEVAILLALLIWIACDYLQK